MFHNNCCNGFPGHKQEKMRGYSRDQKRCSQQQVACRIDAHNHILLMDPAAASCAVWTEKVFLK